jgi:hypothetical protein
MRDIALLEFFLREKTNDGRHFGRRDIERDEDSFGCMRNAREDPQTIENERTKDMQKRNSLPNSSLASTTALYPVMFACELKASYVCPRLNVRGMQSIANAVAF